MALFKVGPDFPPERRKSDPAMARVRGAARRQRTNGRVASVPAPAATRRSWARLSEQIRACRLCPLGFLRTNAVVYRGSLAPRVVFVGEAPGVEEDRTGLPFVGRAGSRLNEAIRRVGLADGSYGVLNVLKCRPPENRFDRAAARTCRPYLDRQLALLHPEVIVTLGAWALRSLDPTAPALLEAAGAPREEGEPPLFPWIHPAAAMRSRRWARRWEADLRKFRRWWEARSNKTS